ncbi:mucin-6 [Eurytemora carolleeae]|uniref:mucin-6 n=1 Tax=Eurytemora carolleeae TaxID=1294199 RepID=UPI000C764299|nr:mucin-6 [Eurytemora carolleeae]|eukprot:XP_023333934.1 mucin-6-like [Eurytemora affinis]
MKPELCQNRVSGNRICFTYPDASWVCRENQEVKECDRDSVRLVGHEEIRPKIECKQRSGPPICIPTGCNLLDVEPECVSADLPDKLELKDELCEQCEDGRNKLRTVVVQEKVCLDETQTVCNQIPSTVPSWYKYCNQPVLYTGKYCTVGTSTVINPYSTLVSTVPSWYKYCNQPVLYTGSDRTPDDDLKEEKPKGRDVRPIDNKNIGGADVYFANQFLQQQNLGDKPLGQIEVSETTLAGPYITEYNLNPRFFNRPTPQPVTAAASTTQSRPTPQPVTASASTTQSIPTPQPVTAVASTTQSIPTPQPVTAAASTTQSRPTPQPVTAVASTTQSIPTPQPVTAAASTTQSIKSTTLASGTALSHSSTEISNVDSAGNSSSSTQILLSDSITVTSFTDLSSETPSAVANVQQLVVNALPISETEEDLLDYGDANSGINFLDQLLYDTGVADNDDIPSSSSGSLSFSSEESSSALGLETTFSNEDLTIISTLIDNSASVKPSVENTNSVLKPISASTDSVLEHSSASTDLVLELSLASTEPFFEHVSTSADPTSYSNLEVPPNNDIQELKNDILGEDDNNEGFEYVVSTGRNIIEASNLNNFEISNPNNEYLPFSNDFGIAYKNNEFGVVNINNDYGTSNNENGVSKIFEKNRTNKDVVLVNAANWKSYEHMCRSIENKKDRARCRIITCFNNSTDCFFPK